VELQEANNPKEPTKKRASTSKVAGKK
jgi:hypothetical protein